MGNDDGFGSAQLHEMKRFLDAAGHKTVVVAPVDNQSGQGGRAVYTTSRNLTVDSEFGLVPAGSPSLGRDPHDPDIWYYNGTPAACTFVALDFVIPRYYNNISIDLYTGGPNFGGNAGPFLYTLSGTANSEQRSYKWINSTTKSGHPDPATIHGKLAATLVGQLVNATKPGHPILPLGYGIGVNTPFITSLTNSSCIDPPFIQTRLTGGAFTDSAVYNETTGLFKYGNALTTAINRCINGNCALPGETDIVDSGCQSSVSVFTVDYDAPLGRDQRSVRLAITPLVVFESGGHKMMEKVRREISGESLLVLSGSHNMLTTRL
jgi:5'-nucleotidase